MAKTTDNLMKMINKHDKLDRYLAESKNKLIDCSLNEFLEKLLEKYNANKADVLKRCGINQIYGYQIFAGSKMPTRNKVIALCFGFPLNIEDSQYLLQHAGASILYPKVKRDSIILFGIDKRFTIFQVDDLLFEEKEKTIL